VFSPRFIILLLFFFASISFARAEGKSIESLRAESLKLGNEVLNEEALFKAVDLLERILESNPNDLETLSLYARVCWSLGNHQTEGKEQKKWFKKGQEFANKLKEYYPDKPDGYYWYGVNYGEFVDRSSIFAKIGAKKVIVENMEKVISLNDKFDSGGAYIILGRINYIAPGGSYSKAIQYYEKAIELGPKRTTAYLYLGELYLHEHVFDKAEELLLKVIKMEIDPRYGIEGRDDKTAAQKLFKKLDRKDDRFPEQEDLTGR
jgi:tetratricopeptide (TPR) repeat protein